MLPTIAMRRPAGPARPSSKPDGRDGTGSRQRLRFRVTGSVGHWGHVHQRSNQYLADITVRVIDDAWRITDLEVLSEERIQAPPSAATVPGGM